MITVESGNQVWLWFVTNQIVVSLCDTDTSNQSCVSRLEAHTHTHTLRPDIYGEAALRKWTWCRTLLQTDSPDSPARSPARFLRLCCVTAGLDRRCHEHAFKRHRLALQASLCALTFSFKLGNVVLFCVQPCRNALSQNQRCLKSWLTQSSNTTSGVCLMILKDLLLIQG